MAKRGAPRFRPGQAVTWVDPDENNVMQPHTGIVESVEVVDGARVYAVRETDSLWQIVLEEELSPLKREA